MARQTLTLPAPDSVSGSGSNRFIFFGSSTPMSGLLLDPAFVVGGGTAYLISLWLVGTSTGLATSYFYVSENDADAGYGGDVGPELTTEFEDHASSITLTSSNGSVVIPGPNNTGNAARDSSEPYGWEPSVSVRTAIATWIAGWSTGDEITLTIDDGEATPGNVAPEFDDPTGDAQAWQADSAIATLTVPAATGTPTPTYAVVGSLPAGLSFDASSREITGTPDAAGSGTITIRATNSEGTADWTVNYTIAAAPAPEPVTVTASISGQERVQEGMTVVLTATVGGTATGAITYAWSVLSGPGTIQGAGDTMKATYEAPADVTMDTVATVQVIVTREGEAATDTFDVTVQDAAIPTLTVAINGPTSVAAGAVATLSTRITGTATGAIAYTWSVVSGGGQIFSALGSARYQSAADITRSVTVTIRVVAMRDMQTASDDFLITVTYAPPTPIIETPVTPSTPAVGAGSAEARQKNTLTLNIYNAALALVGSSLMNSLEENTPQRFVCSSFGIVAFNQALTRVPWNFARKDAEIENGVEEEVGDMTVYRYARPADFVRLWTWQGWIYPSGTREQDGAIISPCEPPLPISYIRRVQITECSESFIQLTQVLLAEMIKPRFPKRQVGADALTVREIHSQVELLVREAQAIELAQLPRRNRTLATNVGRSRYVTGLGAYRTRF